MLNRLIGLIVIAGLVVLAVSVYKYNTVDFNGYYQKSKFELLHINNETATYYTVKNGNVLERYSNIKILENNEILSFTALEAEIYRYEDEKLKEADNKYYYKKINEEEFNNFMEETKK